MMNSQILLATSTSSKGPAKKKSALLPMAAGCIAGGIEATCVWPMEYIKTQLQLQSNVQKKPLPYTGVISGLSYTVNTTGFFSLYRGLAPTLIGSIPKAGIRFGLNAVIKDNLRDKDGKLTLGKNFVAGLGAGVSEALIIVAPVETVKTKCIELNKSFLSGMKYIIQTEGVSGIYKGVTATALKQGSNMGLRFMWFNKYKEIITKDGEKKMTPLMGLFGGMSAGCFSTLGNNPFDVIKVCLSVNDVGNMRLCLAALFVFSVLVLDYHPLLLYGCNFILPFILFFTTRCNAHFNFVSQTRLQGTNASKYASTYDCFQQILRNEGVSAFYVGVVPRMGRVVPGQGIIFMSFETIQQTLEQFQFFQ
mmetsp:Transcript_35853/g.52389  ORF Transcript_35853/g.52389 Transcript_35853/m.52389 type:complete len:363 (-) Transcript_35853:118-1206(-)